MDDARAIFLPLDALRRRRSAKWRTYDPDVLPLWVAEMDVALAPAIAETLSAALILGDTGYAHAGGLAETYAAFSARRYGWTPAADRISLTPDVMHGIAAVLELVTAPGDGVVINPPVYPPFRDFITHVRRRVVDVPLLPAADGYTLDLEGLDTAFADATAYLLCSPHNPTGQAWDRATLSAVAELAQRHEVMVLADEVHAPLTYEGTTHVPFGSLDRPAAQRAVLFVSASKGWNLPGLKTALTLAGPLASADLATLPWPVQAGAGLFGTMAAHAAFAEGEAWLASLLKHLDDNRRLLATLLDEHVPDVGYRMPDATYLAWLDCRQLGLGDDPAAVFLERGRVALSNGHAFGTPGTGFARLNFATAQPILIDAVQRMAAAVDR